MNVAIIDYGMGNLDSAKRAIEEAGGNPYIIKNSKDLKYATHIILPGDGAFPDAMTNLKKANLVESLKSKVLGEHIPFLGICLGMQLLADTGYEGRQMKGLGWIKGEVKRLIPPKKEAIPHIGWNEVNFIKKSPLFKDIGAGKDFYFVHSFHFICKYKNNILAQTSYCGKFNSIIGNNNIFGVQFHPEKSQKAGLQLLKNFLTL